MQLVRYSTLQNPAAPSCLALNSVEKQLQTLYGEPSPMPSRLLAQADHALSHGQNCVIAFEPTAPWLPQVYQEQRATSGSELYPPAYEVDLHRDLAPLVPPKLPIRVTRRSRRKPHHRTQDRLSQAGDTTSQLGHTAIQLTTLGSTQ